MILACKHHGREDLVPTLATLMYRHCRALLEECDLVVPIPCSRFRLASRGFDHAALLASHLARLAGKPCACDLLRRVRHAPMQHRLPATERRRRQHGTMGLHPAARKALAGRHVLLVDDVFTTGATMREACRALAPAAPASICIATLASAALDD